MVNQMRKEETREIVNKLLKEIEEEDIGISLFTTFYQSDNDLKFFNEEEDASVKVTDLEINGKPAGTRVEVLLKLK